MSAAKVAVLFARQDSVYKSLPDCEVWDRTRDALNWPGGMPCVAHPPCRAWGRLRTFARPRKHRAASLLELAKLGPAFSAPFDGSSFTAAEASRLYRLWAESWVVPLLKQLVPELKPRARG